MQVNTDPSVSPSSYQKEKDDAIQVLSILFPNGIIAGGAPRNWILGSPAKDIDIYACEDDIPFWETPEWRTLKTQPYIQQRGGNTRTIAPLRDGNNNDNLDIGESGSQRGIKSVHEFVHNNKTFQIITVKKEEVNVGIGNIQDRLIAYIFRAFDFGINKVAIRPSGEIIRHWDFNEDIKNKTLTIHMSQIAKYNLNCIPARFNKMKKYFPDHQVVIK